MKRKIENHLFLLLSSSVVQYHPFVPIIFFSFSLSQHCLPLVISPSLFLSLCLSLSYPSLIGLRLFALTGTNFGGQTIRGRLLTAHTHRKNPQHQLIRADCGFPCAQYNVMISVLTETNFLPQSWSKKQSSRSKDDQSTGLILWWGKVD